MRALRKGFDLPQCICNKAPVPILKASSLIYIITEPIQKPNNISSSSPRLAYIYIWLICVEPLYRRSVDAFPAGEEGKKRKMHSFKQMRSEQKKKKLSWGVFLHLHQFQPMTPVIVILSITLISSSLPQLSLGTRDCTLRIRTKLLWLHSHCYLLNYILLLCTTQDRMRETRCALPIANCEQIALCHKQYTIEPV